MQVDVSILIAVIGCGLAIATFAMNKGKSSDALSREMGTVNTKLDSIQTGIDEIKQDVKNVKTDVKSLEKRVTVLETIIDMKGDGK